MSGEDTPSSSRSPASGVNYDDQLTLLDASSSLTLKASRDSLIGSLIHHYVYVVANILQPIIHPANTYTSIYVPSAVTAFKTMSWESPAENKHVAPSQIALLFSILSSSAFHLRGRRETLQADDLARSCRSKALSHLQLSLSSLPELDAIEIITTENGMAPKLEAVLSVMLTLITADVSRPSLTRYSANIYRSWMD